MSVLRMAPSHITKWGLFFSGVIIFIIGFFSIIGVFMIGEKLGILSFFDKLPIFFGAILGFLYCFMVPTFIITAGLIMMLQADEYNKL